jgi:hypothetical protein
MSLCSTKLGRVFLRWHITMVDDLCQRWTIHVSSRVKKTRRMHRDRQKKHRRRIQGRFHHLAPMRSRRLVMRA